MYRGEFFLYLRRCFHSWKAALYQKRNCGYGHGIPEQSLPLGRKNTFRHRLLRLYADGLQAERDQNTQGCCPAGRAGRNAQLRGRGGAGRPRFLRQCRRTYRACGHRDGEQPDHSCCRKSKDRWIRSSWDLQQRQKGLFSPASLAEAHRMSRMTRSALISFFILPFISSYAQYDAECFNNTKKQIKLAIEEEFSRPTDSVRFRDSLYIGGVMRYVDTVIYRYQYDANPIVQ